MSRREGQIHLRRIHRPLRTGDKIARDHLTVGQRNRIDDERARPYPVGEEQELQWLLDCRE